MRLFLNHAKIQQYFERKEMLVRSIVSSKASNWRFETDLIVAREIVYKRLRNGVLFYRKVILWLEHRGPEDSITTLRMPYAHTLSQMRQNSRKTNELHAWYKTFDTFGNASISNSGFSLEAVPWSHGQYFKSHSLIYLGSVDSTLRFWCVMYSSPNCLRWTGNTVRLFSRRR